MRESPFGFHYDWSDLRPIRALMFCLYAAQLLGAIAGYYGLEAPKAFDRLWTGAVLASLPGYLAGCVVQYLLRAQRFAEHGRMIARIGLIATFLSVLGLSMHLNR